MLTETEKKRIYKGMEDCKHHARDYDFVEKVCDCGKRTASVFFTCSQNGRIKARHCLMTCHNYSPIKEN